MTSDTTQQQTVKGWFRAKGRLVTGWVKDSARPSERVEVEILVGDAVIGNAVANRLDTNVQLQHGGDGLCGFAFYLPNDTPISAESTAMVREIRTHKQLRTKMAKVSAANMETPPLSLLSVSATNLTAKIDGYPVQNTDRLEFWSHGVRHQTTAEFDWIDVATGVISTTLPDEIVGELLTGPVQIGLPGLVEAQLGVTLNQLSLSASVERQERGVEVNLSGADLIGTHLCVEIVFNPEQGSPVRLSVELRDGQGNADWPIEVPEDCKAATVLISGVAIPTELSSVILIRPQDSGFHTLNQEVSEWTLSAGAEAERSFFAFPAVATERFGVTGPIARIRRLSDNVPSEILTEAVFNGNQGDRVQTCALFRAPKGTSLTITVRDQEGDLGACSKSSGADRSWLSITFEVTLARATVEPVVVSFQFSGGDGEYYELAIPEHKLEKVEKAHSTSSNLLANDLFDSWPSGIGIREQIIRGEICEGWSFFNRKSSTPVRTRAYLDQGSGQIGIALAAPQISDYLRVEADLVSELLPEHHYTLNFSAGVPPVARQLLAQSTEPVPDFMQIDRIVLLRRVYDESEHGIEIKDKIVSVLAKKLPVSWEDNSFSIDVKIDHKVEKGGNGFWTEDDVAFKSESLHLLFEFRRPTIIGLHSCSLYQNGSAGALSLIAPVRLEVEDRNISLQLDRVKGLQAWASVDVKLGRGLRHIRPRSPIKWKSSAMGPVEVVVPVYNAIPETLLCLDALGRTSTVPILVKLIDDCSEPAGSRKLQEFALDRPWITYHRFDENKGYTFAADYGVRNAQSEWVVLLNSDTIVSRFWLEGLMACAKSDPKIAFVGPVSNAATYQSVPDLYDGRGKWKVNSLPDELTIDDMADLVSSVSHSEYPRVPLLNGFCTLMRRDVFLEAGGLNRGAFPAGYGEENDLCLRVVKSGRQLAVADNVYVYHSKSASFGNARRDVLSKQGTAALKKLHPEVDFGELGKTFKESAPLAQLRYRVSEALRHWDDTGFWPQGERHADELDFHDRLAPSNKTIAEYGL